MSPYVAAMRTPSRIAFESSCSSASTLVRKDSMRSSIDFPALTPASRAIGCALAQEAFLFTSAARANRLLIASFR